MALLLNETIIKTQTIDSLIITSFEVDMERNRLIIMFNRLSGEILINTDSIALEGQSFADLIAAIPDGNLNFYENIKAILYESISTKLNVTGTLA